MNVAGPFLLFLLLSVEVKAQQYSFSDYTTRNGMVNNEVRCILQSSNGAMYFGTPTGVSQYDGARFTNYNYKTGFSHSLVIDVKEKDGDLLFFPVSRFHYRLHEGKLSKDSTNQKTIIKNLFRKQNGEWLACTDDGIFNWGKNGLVRIPVYNDSKSQPLVNFVCEWQDSLLVVGRGNLSLDVFNTKTWEKIASSQSLFVRSLCKDMSGNVWVATIDNGMQLLTKASLQGDSIQFQRLPKEFDEFSQTEFRSVICDKAGTLWMGSVSAGLIHYDPQSGLFQHITTTNGLESNTVYSLYNDREQNIWIGTNTGVQKLTANSFQLYSSRHGLPSDLVLDIVKTNDGVLFEAGYSGIGVIDNGIIHSFKGLMGNNTFLSLSGYNGKIYGITSQELCELKYESGKMRVVKRIPTAEPGVCMTIIKDRLVIACKNGLYLFDKDQLVLLTKEKIKETTCIYSKDDYIWLGNYQHQVNGYQFVKNGDNWEANWVCGYTGKGYDNIHCISTDDNKTVYIGTRLAGLFKVDNIGKSPVTRQLKVNDGLSDNNIRSFLFLSDHSLLVGTGSGVDRIFAAGKDSLKITNINNFYGFSSTVYKIVKDTGSQFLLGTETGLIRLAGLPTDDTVSQNLPIFISSLELLNNPDSLFDVHKPIHLQYGNSTITINYASPVFSNERSLLFSYWLKGSGQKVWSSPSTNTSVSFPNLSPGRYTFMVRAIGPNGNPSEKIATLELFIDPPFWRTWWFIFLIIFLISASAVFLVRRRIETIRKEAGFKQAIAESEMMALRAQMNPHFIFNCISSIDNFIQDNDKENASAWLNKFAKLIRGILDNSHNDVVPLWKDWATTKLYLELEQLRSDNAFEFTMEADSSLLNGHYRIPPLIVQPYVENAIHHGIKHRGDKLGRILIKASLIGQQLQFEIDDNGVGRKRAAELKDKNPIAHTSYGLQMSSERIALFNGDHKSELQIIDKKDKAGNAEGTKVLIRLWV